MQIPLKGLRTKTIITMTRTNAPETQLNMDNYKITETKGHHEPNGQRTHHARCGCSAETSGGYAYRDKVAKNTNDKAEWDKIRFYHQSPVVKVNFGVEWLVNTHGHGLNPTTRERINKELPRGFNIRQRDYEVKLEVPNGDLIELPVEKFRIDYKNKTVEKPDGETICGYEPVTPAV